ncbi:MAG: gliding motility-associated C-terminal domain-containing protein [Flavobacteriia bacterium]|nr:gliding motility-associated C-terminal domain-containing protein [Flavobacteriia bacterium]
MKTISSFFILFFPLFGTFFSKYKDPKPLIFAEIFTPNSDGNNDFFVIQNIEEYPINKIHIFNRNGDKVYDAEPYLNDWNGVSNVSGLSLGKKLIEGTYFYRFEYLIGDFEMYKSGKVILMR